MEYLNITQRLLSRAHATSIEPRAMSDDLKKKTEPLCVVSAQPASKVKCAKCAK